MVFYRKILLILRFHFNFSRMDETLLLLLLLFGWLAACSCHFCPVCVASSEKILCTNKKKGQWKFDVISLIIIIRLVIIFLNCCTIIQRYIIVVVLFFFLRIYFSFPTARVMSPNEWKSKQTHKVKCHIQLQRFNNMIWAAN